TRAVDGGLFIASRFPMLRTAQHAYKHRRSPGDANSSKGVLYTRLGVPTKDGVSMVTLHVFNTHTEASYTNEGSVPYTEMEELHKTSKKVRMKQLEEMVAFIKASLLDAHPQEPVLLFGDFNVNSIKARDPTTTGVAAFLQSLETNPSPYTYECGVKEINYLARSRLDTVPVIDRSLPCPSTSVVQPAVLRGLDFHRIDFTQIKAECPSLYPVKGLSTPADPVRPGAPSSPSGSDLSVLRVLQGTASDSPPDPDAKALLLPSCYTGAFSSDLEGSTEYQRLLTLLGTCGEVDDLLVDCLEGHPVTFGDVVFEREPEGVEGEEGESEGGDPDSESLPLSIPGTHKHRLRLVPREQVLTAQDIQGCCVRLDYVFLMHPHPHVTQQAGDADTPLQPPPTVAMVPRACLNITSVTARVEPFRLYSTQKGAPTQLSDHYGVEVEFTVNAVPVTETE
ncbi:hypothetical protein KIPB_007617, partial [Kipferlia bialata]